MNIEEFRNYCIELKGVTECFPFDETTLVFKVMGKMFALINVDSKEPKANLKCDPELALELREKFNDVNEAYHMSKVHWNTITIDGALSNAFIIKQIDNSYKLVIKGLTKKIKEELQNL